MYSDLERDLILACKGRYDVLDGYQDYKGEWLDYISFGCYDELEWLYNKYALTENSIKIYGLKEDIEKSKQLIVENNLDLMIECQEEEQ